MRGSFAIFAVLLAVTCAEPMMVGAPVEKTNFDDAYEILNKKASLLGSDDCSYRFKVTKYESQVVAGLKHTQIFSEKYFHLPLSYNIFFCNFFQHRLRASVRK